MNHDRCSECGSENTLCDRFIGERMCKDCGLVIEDTLFEDEPYIDDLKKCQARHPYLVSAGTRVPNGKIVRRPWLISTKQKNILHARKRIGFVASKIDLPDVVKAESHMLYKKAVEEGLTIGRDNTSILYACIYTACILNQVPKTAEELANIHYKLSKRKLLRSFNLLKKNIDMNVGQIDPVDLIPRFGSNLELKQRTITKAIEIAEAVKRTNQFAGKHPRVIASSSIYLATKLNDDKKTQRAIAEASGILEVTIRKRSKEIAEALGI